MNGIIIIDKPAGWTSHDVVGKLRGILRERRIGHGGTLDPMATGTLPVFIGRATRAVEFCESADKEYIAGLRTGIVTDTQDVTGTVLETHNMTITSDDLKEILPNFLGEQAQIPPMYSAIKINGQKLYQLARRGVEIRRPARTITIKELEFLGETEDGFLFRIVCSKGTYIRTLCHDIGAHLGCGGTMSYLRRTRAGAFSLNAAVTLEQVSEAMQDGSIDRILLPVDAIFEYPPLTIDKNQARKCRNGTAFPYPNTGNGLYRVYDEAGQFLMLGSMENGIMSTVKSFFEV